MDWNFFFAIDEARDHMHAMGIPGEEWEQWLWLLRFECRALGYRLVGYETRDCKEY